MLTLAIETSGLSGSVAILNGERLLAEHSLALNQQHGQVLIPAIRAMLAEQGIALRDCRLIAVSTGPGSFTGLRVGIVCAKSLAYVLKIPAVGVESFAAIAENSPSEISHIQVVEDAQRGDVFIGHFERQPDGHWGRNGPIQIRPAAEWLESVGPGDVVSGPGLRKFTTELSGRCEILPEADWRPRAGTIGRLGQRLIAAGDQGDPWGLEPLYLRRSSAEENWEARQRRAGSSSALPDAAKHP